MDQEKQIETKPDKETKIKDSTIDSENDVKS